MGLINKKIYNKNQDSILFEQYRLYVESADKISDRRINTNVFFISLNTILLTMIGIFYKNNILLAMLSILGFILSILWLLNIVNYIKINKCKFNIINELEKFLPVKPYSYEWYKIGKGKNSKNYIPVSKIESCLPIIFMLVYIATIIFCICSKVKISISII